MTSLPAAAGGERFEFDSPAGRLCAYVDGKGPPMLLVHSVNAAASVAEVRPVYDHFRATRTVFALDLPGFGFSDRSERPYTPRLMTDAVLAALEQVRGRCADAPVDVLGLSLGSEFVARAARERPERVATLALVSPTGLRGGQSLRAAPGSTRGMPLLHAVLRGPGWGGALFRALTRPGVIRYFLERTWGGEGIDEDLWRYCVATTRQPGAENAPLQFLSGNLFSADIQDVYEGIRQPAWLSHGVRGDFTDYREKGLLEGRPNWRFTVFQTGAMPYFEVPGEFFAAYEGFLAGR